MSDRGSDKLAAVFEVAQAKLNENAHKGGWEEDRLYDLIYLFDQEVAEFKRAIARRQATGRHGVLDELGDVVNYGTMIADKLGAFKENTPSCACRVHGETPMPREMPLSFEIRAIGDTSRGTIPDDAQTGTERLLERWDREC